MNSADLEGDVVSSSVVTAAGDPLSEATVQVFDASDAPTSVSRVEETTTDTDGSFSVSYSDPALVVFKGTSRGALWFGALPLEVFVSDDQRTIPNKLIFGPTVARGVDNNLPYNTVTAWVTYDPDVPQQAEIRAELTNVITSAGATSAEPYDVDKIVDSVYYDLSNGLFSLTYPQDRVTAFYGVDEASSRFGWPTSHVAHTRDEEELDVLSTFHPMNPESVAIPVYEASFWSMMGLTGDEAYSQYFSANEAAQTFEGGMGEILGTLGPVGSLYGFFQTVDWAYGKVFDYRQTSVPDDAEMISPDQNKFDTILVNWDGNNDDGGDDAVSALASFPIEFEDAGPVSFTIQAEWRKSNIDFSKDVHGKFSYTFDLEPISGVVPVEGEQEPTDPDGDGLYEDVDGDGSVTQADSNLLAENLDSPPITGNTQQYDFNNNGKVDYADVVVLSEESE
jgi:PKD repeat protein